MDSFNFLAQDRERLTKLGTVNYTLPHGQGLPFQIQLDVILNRVPDSGEKTRIISLSSVYCLVTVNE